jgi:plastocyanin
VRLRIASLVLIACLFAGCTPPAAAIHEVVLVARGMTFVLEGQPDAPNPVIPLRAGQTVHVVLRNEAPGLLHDFAIPAWKVQTEQIRAGQSTDVTFRVPETTGRVEYHCRPHAQLMNGFIDVTR